MSCKPLRNMSRTRKSYLKKGQTYMAKQVLQSMRSHAFKYHRADICMVTGEKLRKTKRKKK